MKRRNFLRNAAALALAPAKTLPAAPGGFRHRVSLGWITDWASRGEPRVAWPSMRLDHELLEDHRRSFDALRRLGFNAVCIWGLYVSRYWPLDISSAVPPARGRAVEKLIALAHQRGLQVYSGLGVYSWGFEAILKAHPELARTNPQAMCGSDPRSWEWMRRVTDFVFQRFPIDGVSMQSADQGRCTCQQCRRTTDTEYHARINARVAQYIRGRWPGKLVAAAGWGMHFDDPAGLPALAELSRHLDYLIDVDDTSRRRDPAHRRRLIAALKCDFGTLGGPQVEPPQHWARDRWFLPSPRGVAWHLGELYNEGGRACEFFAHILENPADEITTWMAGLRLNDPAADWGKQLSSAVRELYGTRTQAATEALCGFFLRAEQAYWKYLPPAKCGNISLEPLVSSQAGPPIYLSKVLNAAQRQAYRRDLAALQAEFARLASEVPDRIRSRRIQVCLENAIGDIDRLRGT